MATAIVFPGQGSQFDPVRAAQGASNAGGDFHRPERDAMIDALVRQVSGTVDWLGNMRALSARADTIYEVGPNRPLRRFFERSGATARSIVNLRVARKELSA